MRSALLGDLVAEVTAGDWGSGEPAHNMEECIVVRATDFPRLAEADLSSAPHRFLKHSSVLKRRVASGELLVEMSGGSEAQPTGRLVRITDEVPQAGLPVTFSNFVKRLRLTQDVDPHFFALSWEALYRQGKTRPYEKRTTGIRNFRLDDFLASEAVPIPTLGEQQRIARNVSTIEAARTSERLSADRRQGLRVSLANRLLAPQEGWERAVAFDEVVEIVSGQVDPRNEPYASLLHVAPDSIESNTGRLLSVRTARDLGLISGKYYFEPGDVLYSKIRPYLNKATIAPFSGTCSADMYVLRGVPGRLTNSYLVYVLLSDDFLSQATSYQNRTGIPKINRRQLASIRFDLPPIEEQDRIAHCLMTADTALCRSLEVEAALGQVFESALVELLDSAV